MQQQFWVPIEENPYFLPDSLRQVVRRSREKAFVIQRISSSGQVEFGVGFGGKVKKRNGF